MAKKNTQFKIRCQHFCWRIYQRDGVWYADGRSDARKPGRHSLGTRDRAEAEKNLVQLDQSRAVEMELTKVLVKPEVATATLSLEAGRKLYEEHLDRPRIAGGVRASTKKRYRTVFDKFIEFAKTISVATWNEVSSRTLTRYAAHLEKQDYRSKTQRNELTTVGQAIRWLCKEGHLAGTEPITLKLTKVESERAYCYQPAEVAAMLEHCRQNSELAWLADVITGLTCTGLRISELASLTWADIDFERLMLNLTDETGMSSRGKADKRKLKSGRSRSLPLHTDLLEVLHRLPKHVTFVFLGPRGGRIKPDTIRNILIRDVIVPLKERFPARPGAKSFADGRLHSFRHYFASMCANQGTAERIAMEWLGHADSEMVRHYYHLHDDESRQQMAKLVLLGKTGQQSPGNVNGIAKNGAIASQQDEAQST